MTRVPAGSRPAALWRRTTAFARNLPARVHERDFWIIQGLAIGITVAHIVAEAWGRGSHNGLTGAFHHIPVVLYLAPISYASLRFGTEGAVLTGVWSTILTLPNTLLWHRADYEWATELSYVVVVITVGAIVALPVERERRQRERAEATSRRLALLDEIATLTLTADLQHTVDQTLTRLLRVLELDRACVAVADPERGTLRLLACCPPAGSDDVLTPGMEQVGVSVVATERPARVDEHLLTPLIAHLPHSGPPGSVEGLLAVHLPGDRALDDDDERLLAGVASHLAIAIASAQLQESERERARSYVRSITQAQEDERARIARELHDEAAQNLVVLRRELDAMRSRLGDTITAEDAGRLRDLAGQTLAGVRRFSRALRPPTLDDLGLPSALAALVEEVGARSDLCTELHVTGEARRLAPEVELAVFRIGQAAIHNAEQHADAESVGVHLVFEPATVRVTVEDDGHGFEPPDRLEDLSRSGKLGLIGMRERAELVGGNLRIERADGHGTRIVVTVPG